MVNLKEILEETIPLKEHSLRWMFENEEGQLPSKEHLDQIFPLTSSAAVALSKFEQLTKIGYYRPMSKKYFQEVEEFVFGEKTEKEVKKWLYQRQIKFDTVVYINFDSTEAFAMTYKMLIHYAANLFVSNETVVWDKTLNWGLYYDHNDVFYFAKNRIYDGQKEKLKFDQFVKEVTQKKSN